VGFRVAKRLTEWLTVPELDANPGDVITDTLFSREFNASENCIEWVHKPGNELHTARVNALMPGADEEGGTCFSK
jgi:hypothetical protein